MQRSTVEPIINMRGMHLIRWLGLGLWMMLAVPASAQNELVFAVTEGVTYQATPKEIRDKFAPVADAIARATGRRVRTVLVPAYNDVRAGLAKHEYDVAYIHPAHVAMAEIKAGRYKAVAWTTGFTEYTVTLLIGQGFSAQDGRGPEGPHAGHAGPRFDYGGHGARHVPRGKADRHRREGADALDGAGHHDPLPGRGAVLHRARLRASGRHGGERRGQGMDREGRQGALPLAPRPHQADRRVGQDVRRTSSRRSATRS